MSLTRKFYDEIHAILHSPTCQSFEHITQACIRRDGNSAFQTLYVGLEIINTNMNNNTLTASLIIINKYNTLRFDFFLSLRSL